MTNKFRVVIQNYLPSDNSFDTFCNVTFVESSHVGVHLLEILCQRTVCVAPWYRAEFEHGFMRKGLSEPVIVHTGELMKLFPRDHEGSQIGSVNGEEDHGK